MRSITSFSPADIGVSVVVPVLNGAASLRRVLVALLAEGRGRPFEIIVIDDGSADGSIAIADDLRDGAIRILAGSRRGAAAAINLGLHAARFPVVAQVDQDVVVEAGWLIRLLEALAIDGVAAAQGWYATDPSASVIARVMALDLEQRYERIREGGTDHVCTGNVVWRRDAIDRIGGLDETLGYGYDNDLSYRLVAAGYRLVICPRARSLHQWRDGWIDYLRQQYGFGYGRLDLVARHRTRVLGDRVSPAIMMAHPVAMAAALLLLVLAAAAPVAGRSPAMPAIGAGLLIAALAGERLMAGVSAARRHRDWAALCFPVAHLLRDVVWVLAIGWWSVRRVTRRSGVPHDSMRPRPTRQGVPSAGDPA